MKVKLLTEAKKKNTYKIYYISKDTDLTTSAIIHAYFEKQAAYLFRRQGNVYRIVDIECVKELFKNEI